MQLGHNSILRHLIKDYKKHKVPVPFDFKKASLNLLNNTAQNNGRNFHYIHAYPGRIYPYIPLFLLSLNDFSNLKGYVLDPFAGSGTILLESILNPVMPRNALGVEINPLARLISQVKTTPLNPKKAKGYLTQLKKAYANGDNADKHIPNYKNLSLWFSPKAIDKLAKLKGAISIQRVPSDYKKLFWVSYANIVRKVSKADPYIPPPVVLKLYKYRSNSAKYNKLKNQLTANKNPDIWNVFKKSAEDNIAKLSFLSTVDSLTNNKIRAEIIWDDACSISRASSSIIGKFNKKKRTKLKPNSVSMVFTSPPYLTAQKYIRSTKLELLWLGYKIEEINDLDKNSIGTEIVSLKADIKKIGMTSIDLLVEKTYTKSKARGVMVYDYFRRMLHAFYEMHRVLKQNGYAILVLGNNSVLGKSISTYRLLVDEAVAVGFKEILILKDKIKSRSMMTSRNGTGGLIKNEYIIILKKGV